MTAPTTTPNASDVAPRPRSRLRARIVVATLAAIGFAALAWAAFLPDNMWPLPRLTYTPSDSVAVGWYRIDPRTASLPRPLSVDSIVLVPLPATAAAFAGVLAASNAAPPRRRCLERQRKAKAEGKTKGRGTGPRRKPVCTWGWRGTERLRRRAAFGARVAPMQACPRASHDRTRHSLQGERP